MKTLLLASLLALCLVTTGSAKNKVPDRLIKLARFERSVEFLKNSLLNEEQHQRAKRDLRSQLGVRSCLAGCSRRALREMRAAAIPAESLVSGTRQFQGSGSLVDSPVFDAETFEDYCDATLKAKECMEACLERYPKIPAANKRLFTVAFRPINYLCDKHFDDFVEAFPCFDAIREEVSSVCEPKCGDFDELVVKAKRKMQQATIFGNYKKMSRVLQEQCSFLRCTMKCETKILRKQCENRKAATLLNDLASIALKSVQEMLENVPGAIDYWPHDCRILAEREVDFESQEENEEDVVYVPREEIQVQNYIVDGEN